MVGLRLISLGLAATICLALVYLAVTQRFSAITDLFEDQDAVKVEIEEEEKPPPPPPPPPDRPPPPPSVITNPVWREQPNASDFSRYYPERAQEREVEGRATIECIVNADGRLNCTVTAEDPPGYGFGEATLRVSRHFRIAPATRDGAATSGGRIRRTIRWVLPD